MPRSFTHNYCEPSIYHITLSKMQGVEPFGTLIGHGSEAKIKYSRLGSLIASTFYRISELDPNIKVLQYMIMPDHVHLIIRVCATIPRPIGSYIGQLKVRITQQFGSSVFDPDFYDCILYKNRSLDSLFRYLKENPVRLAIRRDNPDFFTRVNHLQIDGEEYQAYGNIHLLENPSKEVLIVHRRYTPEQLKALTDRWLYTAENRGVIVSPFISPSERSLRAQIEELGGKIILITDQSFPERYKPAAHDFRLCAEGRLLIISIRSPSKTLTRGTCLRMNALAEHLSAANWGKTF